MNQVDLLADALEYIENHLKEEIRTEDVAHACCCSKSTLEKLFKCVNQITIREYLVRRRMMKAARLISAAPEEGILEIALEYGYSTGESFARAFKHVWNCNPSAFRHERFAELYPRLFAPLENGDVYMKERKHMDISELYDLLKSRKNCYFLCCDIKDMIGINEISTKAGDLAILETMKRMKESAGEEDIVFRIGGDEFVILTSHEDMAAPREIADRILKCNGTPFSFEGKEIPLSLHVGFARLDCRTLKYDELFTELHQTIRNMK